MRNITITSLFLLLSSGCSLLFPEPIPDKDGDGFTEDMDCDDTDASLNPAAPELCDGIDNDCDGVVDEDGAEGATTWYHDADGDDFGDPAVAMVSCSQPQDWVTGDAGLDCDDGDATINPEADEHCNGIDDDCDGDVDEEASDATTWYQDADGDGYGADDVSILRCEEVIGFTDVPGDCDDAWVEVNPEADEYCDGVDNDCDGDVDEDDALGADTWYFDEDGDGWGIEDTTTVACYQPSLFAAEYGDCDDEDEDVFPGADEVCNDVDDDCDEAVDETDAIDAATWYHDADGDGYGSASVAVTTCEQPSGYVASATDCDDSRADVHPGGTEVCDASNIDEDCDGLVDDLDSSLDSSSALDWYRDDDGDGYGSSAHTITRCDGPSGYIAASLGEDCDDANSRVNPGATEICDTDETDDDCDGLVNTDDPSVDTSTFVTWYADADGDGFGDHNSAEDACGAPSGYVSDDTDCDDTRADVNPDGAEVCDADDADEDCDGVTDDYDGSVDSSTYDTWYADADSDGYGDAASPISQCDQPSGYVTDATDCDDGEYFVNPGAQEVCDEDDIDEDCDGRADSLDRSADPSSQYTFYADDDGDGYGDVGDSIVACDAPAGFVSNANDCDDSRDDVSPAETEVCDAYDTDEDCDGLADDADSSADSGSMSTFYADTDGDSFGDLTAPRAACDAPVGYVADFSDCDDEVATTFPGATEVCNYTDDDCDGDTDEGVTVTYWQDVDLDGEGGSAMSGEFCESTPASGWSVRSSDCDDADPYVYSAAPELCDGQKNDCNDSTWSSSDEEGTASWQTSAGVWSDVTDTWDAGSPVTPAAVTLPTDGTVHLCPANWYVTITAPADAEVTVTAPYGRADTALNGSGGGAVVTLEDDTTVLTLESLTIEEGQSANGAGVTSMGGVLTVTDCLFRYNYLNSSYTALGAAIYASGGSVSISDSTFRANGVYSAPATYGGAVYVVEGSLSVTDSSFENNEASLAGALYWSAEDSQTAAIDGCTFDGNEATSSNGGAIVLDLDGTGTVSLTDSEITDNQASGNGGGLYISGSGTGHVILDGLAIEYNSADDYGGGLYWEADNSGTFTDLSFVGDEADYGGGIAAAANMDLVDTTITDCAAEAGGALYGDSAEITLNAVTITENEADYTGAGIHLDSSFLFAYSSFVTENQVPASAAKCYGGTYDDPYCAGAGIYGTTAYAYISDTEISGNQQLTSQDTFGGGIYIADGDIVLTDESVVTENEAEFGAGVLLYGGTSSTVFMTDGAQITDNEGASYAGLFLDTATFTCTGSASDSTGITSHLDGGGVYVHYEHGPSTLIEADMCDFGSTGSPSDNFDDSTSGRDVYVAGDGWYSYANDASFLCDETGCI